MNMKTLICKLLMMLPCLGIIPIQAQVAVDQFVSHSARIAVKKLGFEMMRGNFKYGHERMYPRWKRRLARRYGGMEKLDTQLLAASRQKIKMGFIVTAFHADRPTVFFSVWRAKKISPGTGKPMKDATGREVVVEHWLAIVPTTIRVQIADVRQGGKIRTLEEESYTIAISEKGVNNWYFMTGMKPTVQDLRSLFPSLPPTAKEMGFPTPKAREIK